MTVDYREYFKLTIDLYFDLWTRYRTLDNPMVLLPFVTGPAKTHGRFSKIQSHLCKFLFQHFVLKSSKMFTVPFFHVENVSKHKLP